MAIRNALGRHKRCLQKFGLVILVLGACIQGASAQREASFIFPDSDRRPMHWRDLEDMSCWNLEIARNEIFARRGRFFNRSDLTRYFEQFPWYRPYTWNPALNRIERENVAFIQNFEQRQRCR